jgi:hypothetical protein
MHLSETANTPLLQARPQCHAPIRSQHCIAHFLQQLFANHCPVRYPLRGSAAKARTCRYPNEGREVSRLALEFI